MTNAGPFALLAALATCLVTLIALFPINRMLGKIGGIPLELAKTFLRDQSLPRLGAGALCIAVAIFLHTKRPRLAVSMLLASPLLIWAVDLILLAADR